MFRVEMRLIGVNHTKMRFLGVFVHGEIDLKLQQMIAEGVSRAQTQAPLVGKRFHVPRRRSEDLP